MNLYIELYCCWGSYFTYMHYSTYKVQYRWILFPDEHFCVMPWCANLRWTRQPLSSTWRDTCDRVCHSCTPPSPTPPIASGASPADRTFTVLVKHLIRQDLYGVIGVISRFGALTQIQLHCAYLHRRSTALACALTISQTSRKHEWHWNRTDIIQKQYFVRLLSFMCWQWSISSTCLVTPNTRHRLDSTRRRHTSWSLFGCVHLLQCRWLDGDFVMLSYLRWMFSFLCCGLCADLFSMSRHCSCPTLSVSSSEWAGIGCGIGRQKGAAQR